MVIRRHKLAAALIAISTVAVVAACSQAEVPLPSNPVAEAAKPADHPREQVSSLPIQPAEPSGGSVCSIEAVQGVTTTEVNADGSVTVDLPASVSGWAYAPADLGKPSDAWLRLLPHDKSVEVREFAILTTIERPDVSEAHGAADAAFSGFADVTIADLPAGSYDAQIVFVTGSARATCDHARRINVR